MLEIQREDGTIEKTELETKAFVPHDFIHYAVEKEAGLKESFWGQIAHGKTFSELTNKEQMTSIGDLLLPTTEIGITEMMTGILTGFLKGDMSEDMVLPAAENIFNARGLAVPGYLTPVFLVRAKETFRKTFGHWNAIGKDEPMLLEWN